MHQDLSASLLILAGAVLIDFLLGEYPHVLHPVVWLGTGSNTVLRLAPERGFWRPFLFGALLTLSMCALAAGVVWLILDLSAASPVLHVALGIFFLKAAMALRALGDAGRQVYGPLKEGKLDDARVALGSLCSRDASALDPDELVQATIESLAENTSDSWVAPLFYFVLLGVPGAVTYRTINTLDAMIGYRGRYEALGKFAARLDDVVNWVPARLTAGLLLLAGCLLRKEVGNGWRVLRRDGGHTPSPNAGRPMAAMAGLLGIRLEKKGVYMLGNAVQPVAPAVAQDAWRIVARAGVMMVGLTALALWLSASFCPWPLFLPAAPPE